jgi:hypothetical protein
MSMRLETRLVKAEEALGVRPDPGARGRAVLPTLNKAERAAYERVLVAQEAGAPLNAMQAAQRADLRARWAAFVQADSGRPHANLVTTSFTPACSIGGKPSP